MTKKIRSIIKNGKCLHSINDFNPKNIIWDREGGVIHIYQIGKKTPIVTFSVAFIDCWYYADEDDEIKLLTKGN